MLIPFFFFLLFPPPVQPGCSVMYTILTAKRTVKGFRFCVLSIPAIQRWGFTHVFKLISGNYFYDTDKYSNAIYKPILLIQPDVCRFQQMRCVDVLWCVMFLSRRVSTAECRNASATNTTAGRNCAGPRWTWRECEWLVGSLF